MSPHALRELRELATAWHLPRRYTRWSAWHEHIPFAMYAVGAFRPRVLVELGAHAGDSYCAFCQAVMEEGLETRCYAIDTWEGDPIRVSTERKCWRTSRNIMIRSMDTSPRWSRRHSTLLLSFLGMARLTCFTSTAITLTRLLGTTSQYGSPS